MNHPPPSDDELRRDAASFHRSLTDLVRAVQSRDRRSVGFHDVSVTQCHALDVLARTGSMSLGELSKELFLDKSTASRVVDSLVRKEYVQRQRDGLDGRVRRISVTAKGQELNAALEHARVQAQLELITTFDAEGRHEVIDCVARLARAAASGLETSRAS